jgi:hypothetical protein
MKLRISCMQCFQEQGHPSDEMMAVEMRDDGLYSMVCEKGHTTVRALQQQKFEILFDIGAMALLDGYPREAITAMAAALERFYEFYVRVICIKHEVDQTLINESWKLVENQSERQFGAYVFASLLELKKACPVTIEDEQPNLSGISKGDTRKWKAFRNAVVHKGYIPSTIEAQAYGNIVFRHIKQLLQELSVTCTEQLRKATVFHLSRARANVASSQQVVSTMSIPTLISLTNPQSPTTSLEEAMKELEKYRKWLHHN